MPDIIDFNKAKHEKKVKEVEDYLLDKLVFEHSDKVFPGYREIFMNESKELDSVTRISNAIKGFKDRISSVNPEIADKYYFDVLTTLVTFYSKLRDELGGEYEDFTNSISIDDRDNES